jgi:DNA-binding response OmpR family regulator
MERIRPLVLVADDDEDILELVRLRLGRSYDTLVARDGAEALALARTHKPDVAVLDVTMPLLDGYSVSRELSRDPSTSSIPVILLTARAQASDVSEGLAAGAHDYVTKPFSPELLRTRVAAALKAAAGSAAVSEPPAFAIRRAEAC